MYPFDNSFRYWKPVMGDCSRVVYSFSLFMGAQTMREKLIELLSQVQYQGNAVHGYSDKYIQNGELADHLIANGVTVQKWIPVTERLPENKGDYLVTKQLFGDSYVRVVSFAKDGRKVSRYDFHNRWKNVWYEYDREYGYITIDSVTHWMPLPEPPKGE